MKHFLKYISFAALSMVAVGCLATQDTTYSNFNSNTTGTKWNPGHYIKLGREDVGSLRNVAGKKGVKGVVLSMFWSDLEPQRGQYNFERIDQFLEELAVHDQHLILLFLDYDKTPGCPSLPQYIKQTPGAVAELEGERFEQGCMAVLWQPLVLERWIALNQALGRKYDTHKYFEGLRTRESTYPIAEKRTKFAYTDQKLVDALAELAVESKKAFPHTNFFLSMSRIGGVSEKEHIQVVIDKMLQGTQADGVRAAGLTNPDTRPPSLRDELIPIWQFEKDYNDRLPIMLGGDTSSYPKPASAQAVNALVDELFKMVTDEFRSHYYYWPKTWVSRNTNGVPVVGWYDAVLAKLAAENGRINTICPTRIAPCLSSNVVPPPPPPPNPEGGEFLLFDQASLSFETQHRGFYPLIEPGDALPASNWLSPKDYFNGEFHVRFVIENAPTVPKGKLQVCIWNMGDVDNSGPRFFPENCAPSIEHSGVGTYTLAPHQLRGLIPTNWHRKDGKELDFERPDRFLIRVVLRGENGCNVTPITTVEKRCPELFPAYDDMRFRTTIAMVPQGETFSGWGSYSTSD